MWFDHKNVKSLSRSVYKNGFMRRIKMVLCVTYFIVQHDTIINRVKITSKMNSDCLKTYI